MGWFSFALFGNIGRSKFLIVSFFLLPKDFFFYVGKSMNKDRLEVVCYLDVLFCFSHVTFSLSPMLHAFSHKSRFVGGLALLLPR